MSTLALLVNITSFFLRDTLRAQIGSLRRHFGTVTQNGGTTGRVAALRSVVDSNSVRQSEINPSFVLAEYYGYLRRNPTDAPDFSDSGYQFRLNKLNSFNGDYRAAEMVKAFIISTEYRGRFGTP